MRKAYGINGWDVLSLTILTLALGRHALEDEAYRGLVCTAVFVVFLMMQMIGDKLQRRWFSRLLNISTLVIVAAYPYLKSMFMPPAISSGPVYGIFAICAYLLFIRIWRYLEQPPHFRSEKIATHETKNLLQTIFDQDRVPSSLNVWRVVPLGMIGIIVYGIALALPIGPLSDEGMVLFMEGGCDWGKSSVFFYSKLGLLLTVNAAMLNALREKFSNIRQLIPHFMVGAVMIVIWWNDTECDHFYGHPQGNLSQMVFEVMAMAILMISTLPTLNTFTPIRKLGALIGINLWYMASFQFALIYFPHWSWSHTFLVSLLVLLPCINIKLSRRVVA